MARYIDKEIICEAYIHLEVDESFSPEKIKIIERELKSFFDARVKFLLGESVQTEVKTEPGSLKVKLTAFAGVATLLSAAVINYPDFREGVRTLYEDSKLLAEATNLETIFITRTPSCDRLHAEARTGVIGRIAKLVSGIESLREQANNLAAPTKKIDINRIIETTRAVDNLSAEAQKLLSKVQTDEDRYCIAKGLHSAFKELPTTLPAEKELENSSLKRSILNSLKLDIATEAEFLKYSNAVRNAKEILKKIGVAAQPQKA
jgi:hypothetical protein